MYKALLAGTLLALLTLPAQAAKGKREVVLDNQHVEVVRLTYPPGAESGMHTHHHPNRVVYFIKGGKLKLVPADATQAPKVLTAETGQALFLPSMRHNVVNIGSTEVVLLETELKAQ